MGVTNHLLSGMILQVPFLTTFWGDCSRREMVTMKFAQIYQHSASRHLISQNLDNSSPNQSETIDNPRCSMYGLFTYIWVVLGVNVGKYTIH